jgi:predicted nucleotidyltransferase
MKKKLLDISGKIDPLNLQILKKVQDITEKLHINFFLVGATVRDMILNYVYGIKIYRRTNDIDFAVCVKGWNEYYLFTGEIEKTGFTKDRNSDHRYFFNGFIIDFIPFGDIADDRKIIMWQDKDKKEMSVFGFEDVYVNVEEILIQTNPDTVVKAASVEGLVILKIIAWNERPAELRIKDAKDIYLILTTYLNAGNEERLYDEHADIVEETTDYELSGARLLGRDISTLTSQFVKNRLLELLTEEKLDILANEMSQYEGLSMERDEKIEKCWELLKNMKKGIEENIYN